ncbi:MAG: serine/threonine-protein phosphatase [Phycisphaerae bacterium]|nr:serine/threonine-protein phosphatase [Phycisphaerae bacterium]
MFSSNCEHCCGLTDTGRERDANEDHFLIATLSKSMQIQQTSLDRQAGAELFSGDQGKLLLVADGIGGYVAGERASELAIDTMSQYVLNILPWFYRLHGEDEEDLYDELRLAIQKCEAVIDAESEAVPEHEGMGTTLTMAYVLWPSMYVVHVGDSRCYVLRGEQLSQITVDHTVAQELVDSGALEREQARSSRWHHVLSSALGRGMEKLRSSVYKAELQANDTVLLCTDGLTECVADADIKAILCARDSEQQTCERLVNAANDAGGTDNITVIVARFPEQ